MKNQAHIDLCFYRLSKAEKFLSDAKVTLEMQMYENAANRSYYAVFHSVRALLALDGKDFKKHSGVISYFQREYIKAGIFSKDFSDVLKDAFSLRSDSDYEDFYVVPHEDIIKQVSDAERFFLEIKHYIENATKAQLEEKGNISPTST